MQDISLPSNWISRKIGQRAGIFAASLGVVTFFIPYYQTSALTPVAGTGFAMLREALVSFSDTWQKMDGVWTVGIFLLPMYALFSFVFVLIAQYYDVGKKPAKACIDYLAGLYFVTAFMAALIEEKVFAFGAIGHVGFYLAMVCAYLAPAALGAIVEEVEDVDLGDGDWSDEPDEPGAKQ